MRKIMNKRKWIHYIKRLIQNERNMNDYNIYIYIYRVINKIGPYYYYFY